MRISKGNLRKFRHYISKRFDGEFRDKNNICRFFKKRAHKNTRRASRIELEKEDGWHTIEDRVNDYDLF